MKKIASLPVLRMFAGRRSVRERGQIIVLVALAAIVMFAIIGMAIDVGRLYAARAQLSRAVDAAALAGVVEFPDADSAAAKAQAYFDQNEPGAGAHADITPDLDNNSLTVNATKSVDLTFIRVLGIDTATVKAHAKAGFGVAFLDAALVIDSTSSMGAAPCNGSQNNTGCPIWEAKNAAKSFMNVLLGASPNGRTVIGVAAFRGCYRSAAQTDTAPMPSSTKTNCVLHDGSGSSQVSGLISNSTTLTSMIDNISAQGGSGTNVCGGLIKGWEVLEGTGNHTGEDNSRRYEIILSDGDNRYTGSYSYQASPQSPHSFEGYSCQPPSSCSNVGGTSSGSNACHDGTYSPLSTISENFGSSTTTSGPSASENFPSSGCTSYAWDAGSGWTGSWSRTPASGNDMPVTVTSPAQGTSCAAQIRGVGTACRAVSLSGVTGASLSYYARHLSWTTTDRGYVEINTSSCAAGSGWTTLHTHLTSGSDTTTSYKNFSINLNSYVGQTVYIRFRGGMPTGNTTRDFYVDTVSVTTTNTSCPNFTTGSGWSSSWTLSPSSGNDLPTNTWTATPTQDTTCHAQLRGVGSITRTLSLSGVGTATLSYYAKRANWESGDGAVVEASSDGTNWTTLQTHTTSNTGTTYANFTAALDAFGGQSTVYIRFRGTMTANDTTDQFYVDAISVTSSSLNGYLNTDDGSNDCGASVKRERQLDIETYEASKGAKADNVEIFVVGFGVCSSDSTAYTDAQCDAQVGNTDADNTADQRLLKCISSSKPGTTDHYYYASSASALPTIFTQIAQQIAHRLIE